MAKSVRLSAVVLSALALSLFAAAGVFAAPSAIDLTKIQTSFKDWDGSFNEALGSWTFQKYWDEETSTFYIDAVSDGDVGTANDYAKNLTKKDWLDFTYVWTEITSQEKLADGFLLIGKSVDYKDKSAKPALSFVLVRKFKNTSIRCKGDAVSMELLTEAINFCKTVK